MRVGVGVTSYNRPECLKECLDNINKYSGLKSCFSPVGFDKEYMGVDGNGNNIKVYIATDTDEDRRGVAYRKNECLRALKDCDYVFLFDDDCFPIKDGWVEWFIKSKQNHLLFLNDTHIKTHEIRWKEDDEWKTAYSYKDCGGVFMFMTKDVIKRVGAFNEKFEKYGFEHAEYSQRIASLTYPKGFSYVCLENTENYLFAHDYSTPNHKSSITDEEKQKCIKNNWDKFFGRNIENIYLPL